MPWWEDQLAYQKWEWNVGKWCLYQQCLIASTNVDRDASSYHDAQDVLLPGLLIGCPCGVSRAHLTQNLSSVAVCTSRRQCQFQSWPHMHLWSNQSSCNHHGLHQNKSGIAVSLRDLGNRWCWRIMSLEWSEIGVWWHSNVLYQDLKWMKWADQLQI